MFVPVLNLPLITPAPSPSPGHSPLWLLSVQTSSATRSLDWPRVREPSVKLAPMPSSSSAKAPSWASTSVSTSSVTAAGTAQPWARGRFSDKS